MENTKNNFSILKIFLLILIIFLIILCGIYIRKFCIISKISNKISNLESINSYYAKVTSVDNDSLHIAESFVKDDVYLTNFKVLSSTSTTDICMYKNPTENIAYSISPNSKRVDAFDIDNSGALFAVNLIHSLSTEFKYSSFVEKFIYITKIKSITNTSCHGSSCYFIDFYDGSQLWIEKDTGLTLRSTAPSLPRIQDYEYKLNITDEITVPDITGYTINYN